MSTNNPKRSARKKRPTKAEIEKIEREWFKDDGTQKIADMPIPQLWNLLNHLSSDISDNHYHTIKCWLDDDVAIYEEFQLLNREKMETIARLITTLLLNKACHASHRVWRLTRI